MNNPVNPVGPKPALEQYARMRSSQSLPVSFVWLRTAALLDTADERSSLSAPVNTALAQLVVDVTLSCEQQVLHCGNILPAQGEMITTALEAVTLLSDRLAVKSGGAYESLVLAEGYLTKILVSTRAFKAMPLEFTPTTTPMAAQYLSELLAVRDLLVSLNKDSLTVSRSEAADLILVETMVTSAQCAILGWPLSRWSDFEQALFYLSNVERLLSGLPRSNKVVDAAALTSVGSALSAARAALTAKSNETSRAKLALLRSAVGKLAVSSSRGSL